MLPEHGLELAPWPVSPRPFFDETMGSWLGRVAGRYRISVAQLNADYLLQLPLTTTRAGWLVMPPINPKALHRLATLARINVRQLEAIQIPGYWIQHERRYWFCKQCLNRNPTDLLAPYWKRQWLHPDFERCSEHAGSLESLRASQIGKCGNMRDVFPCPTVCPRLTSIRLRCAYKVVVLSRWPTTTTFP